MNRYVIQRWIEIITLSVAGTVAFFCFATLSDYLKVVIDGAARLPWWASISGLTIVTSLLMLPLVRLMRLSWGHFRFAHRYPPTLIASLLAATFAAIVSHQFGLERQYAPSAWLYASSAMGTGLILAGCYLRMVQYSSSARQKNSVHVLRTETDKVAMLIDDWEGLNDWAQTEIPITSPEQDLLDRSPMAQRFALRLLQSIDGTTLGLVGPFGSGKTSIIELTKDQIKVLRKRTDPHVWVCKVSCWGFDNSAAALDHILGETIETLDDHVDCLSVRRLPEEYRKAVSSGSSWTKTLFDLFGSQHEPTKQLRRLTPILKAIRARLVIVVEDVDRSKGSTFDPHHVQGMLQRLREVPSVSFILTAASTFGGVLDFAKLCDHIESLSPMDEAAVLELLQAVRNRCLQSFGDIDPAAAGVRETFEKSFLEPPHDLEMAYAGFGLGKRPESRALLSLVSTPRTLKHVIRRTMTTWNTLHGEIDFDDLLITNIVRCGAPEAFDFLLHRMDRLRLIRAEGPNQHEKETFEREKQRFQNEWKDVRHDMEWDKEAAMQLIMFLVPNVEKYFDVHFPTFDHKPQVVRHRYPTDYWRRLLAEEVAKHEVRDQEVLRQIEKWIKGAGRPTALANMLCDSERFTDVWEYFRSRSEADQLLELAAEVIDIVAAGDGPRASGDHHALLAVWRTAKRIVTKDEATKRWLTTQVQTVMHRSLKLCNDLYYYWGGTQWGIVRIEDRDAVRTTLVETAKRVFTKESLNALVDALDAKHPYAIVHLISPADSDREPSSILRDPKDWQWFAPIVIAAAHLNPTKVVPQLACLVGKVGTSMAPGYLEPTYEFDLPRITEMFGDQAEQLMQLLTQEVEVMEYPYRMYVARARHEAQQWIVDHGTASNDAVGAKADS